MKKLMLTMILVLGLMLLPMTASADVYTFTQAELLSMTVAWDNGGLGDLDAGSPSAVGDGALFVGDIYDGTPQWRSIGIGYAWGTVPASAQDLSGYTGYALNFENVNNQDWWINLYMNTGWTDPPASEDDQFSQNGWTKLSPGDSANLILDFTAEGVNNLNHVTNIGFQIAFNETAMSGDLYQGDKFHMQVNPIPEPASMLLLGSGLIGLAGVGRKKFFKK